jgi:hypothetical protein
MVEREDTKPQSHEDEVLWSYLSAPFAGRSGNP